LGIGFVAQRLPLQGFRLTIAQLHVPLENKNPGAQGFHTLSESADDDLLPMSRLMATSLLGGRAPGHETVGQLYARQIASVIATKTPDEKRLLVVGLGLKTAEADRDVFFGIIDLVLQCI
jgi:proteasome assembly chaperone 3